MKMIAIFDQYKTANKIVKYKDENNWTWLELDAAHYISVTTAISYGNTNKKLENYYKTNSKAKIEKNLAEANDFGSKAHEYFESYLLKQDFECPDTHTKHLDKFKAWVDKHIVEVIQAEFTVVNKLYGYGGTADCIAIVKSCEDLECCKSFFTARPVLLDWKTSNSFGISYGFQLAAYRQALIDNALVDQECGMMGVQIARNTGELKSFIYRNYDWCFHAFLCNLENVKKNYFHKLNKQDWPYLKCKSLIINPNPLERFES